MQWSFQWPGTYFEAAFSGPEIFFRLGKGDVVLHVEVDGKALPPLVKPDAGYYRIGGLPDAAHVARLSVATESQDGPNRFQGFFLPPGGKGLPVHRPALAMQFIGDSHTVGYGNTSGKRDCSGDEVWRTTDNTQAFGPLVARHYGADYRIQAISGRGVVRNYGGFAADTLPDAFPYMLFDKAKTESGTWQPQVTVIALGTNDFSTPLGQGEKWRDRAQLREDFEAGFVRFVQSLRRRYPGTYFLLWSLQWDNGEIQTAVGDVVARARKAGEARIGYVPVSGLDMTGCHAHPSAADDAKIARALIGAIDAVPGIRR